jgi:DNA-binding protein HU-beta
MNKAEFISALKAKTGFTNDQAYKAFNGVFDVIAELLEKGDSLTVQSFGTFEVRNRAARVGVNPQTKKPIDINASKAPAFKASYKLKERVNK